MLWFYHDTSASDDDKIMALRIDHGGAAVDAYWAILERIYRDETDLVFARNRAETKALTHRLALGFEDVETFVKAILDIGLLEDTASDDERAQGIIRLHSERAFEAISEYSEKRETARRNAKKGGRKPKANQTQTGRKASGKRAQSYIEEEVEVDKKKRVDGEETQRAPISAQSSVNPDNQIDPPTLDEVRGYFGANCLRGDPDAFFDFYESQGWRKSNGLPIASWTSQAKQWHRKQAAIDAERSAKGEPTAEEAKWKPAKGYDPDAEYERQLREYAERYGDEARADLERRIADEAR